MWNIRRSLKILGCTAFTSATIGLLAPAKLSAQEHRHHPPQDMPLHEK